MRRRRLTDDARERAAERAEAGEADVQADLGDAAVRRAQQVHGPLDAAALQVAVGVSPKVARNVRMRWVGERQAIRASEAMSSGCA
jgi:hypothetical protein